MQARPGEHEPLAGARRSRRGHARGDRRNRIAASVLSVALAVASGGGSAQGSGMSSGGAPPPPPRSAPAPSAESAALLERLQRLASSATGADQAELRRQLGDPQVLDR